MSLDPGDVGVGHRYAEAGNAPAAGPPQHH
jgi:hypothetical protein